jgi:hypothetical protein
MCVDGVPRTQRHGAFKRRSGVQHPDDLQNEDKGVRGGIVEANAAGEVLLIDAMSIMMGSMNLAARGCAERARRSR